MGCAPLLGLADFVLGRVLDDVGVEAVAHVHIRCRAAGLQHEWPNLSGQASLDRVLWMCVQVLSSHAHAAKHAITATLL